MSTSVTTVVVLLAAACLIGLLGWWVGRRGWARLVAALLVVLLGTVVLVVALTEDARLQTRAQEVLVLSLTAVLAIAGGGPVTTAVFGLVDRGSTAEHSVRRAAEVLRGGAWIGALERIAIHAALVVGWPEGLALALAVKSLGRYPELRHQERAGIAERFLIGTFVSVLWAASCAGVVLLLRG